MNLLNRFNAITLRLVAEASASAFLAFIIVSVVLSATTPGALSFSDMLPLA